MHEISICEGILNMIESEFNVGDFDRVREIYVKVGILSCVDAGLLKHIFPFVASGTVLENAELVIEQIDVVAECARCGLSSKVEKYVFLCPHCGASLSKIKEGNELIVHKIILYQPEYEKINQQADRDFAGA